MNEKTDRMKKYLFFLSALSLTLFTACSSEEDVAAAPEMTQAERDAAIIAEANKDSEVEIRLGFNSQSSSTTTTAATRTPLESDANGLFETPAGKYLGIYCLAQKPQITVATPGPVAENNISWISEATTLQYLMERNQPAQVKILHDGDYIGNVPLTEDACDVQFLETNGSGEPTGNGKIYYYPYGNWYNYHFYGYYPRQTGTNVSESANKVTVDYAITGTEDIIYAKATPPTADVDKGFNAKYMRSLQDATGYNQLEDLPKLAFSHKLAQLRFYVKCASATYNSYGYGTEIGNAQPYKKLFQIQNLTLVSVPNECSLTVADRATPANEGVLARKNSNVIDIPVKKMALLGSGAVDPDNTDNTDVFDGTAAKRLNIPYVPDGGSETPLLLGYAMVPTTAMMDGFTLTGRQEPTKPYITFTIFAGQTKDNSSGADIAGSEYTPVDQAIEIPNAGLEAGKVYNVILNIPPPEEIHMHATLDGWVTVTVTESSDQNIDMTID